MICQADKNFLLLQFFKWMHMSCQSYFSQAFRNTPFSFLGKTVEQNGKRYIRVYKEVVTEPREILALYSIVWIFTFWSNYWAISNCIFMTRTHFCCSICVAARSDYLVTQFYYTVLPLNWFSQCYWSTWMVLLSHISEQRTTVWITWEWRVLFIQMSPLLLSCT